MRVPEAKIDEIRNASNILDVVASYVRLKKRGKNFLGLCPFHQEKTPSFTVSAEKQMYHCFGCGVGGNVFTFLMELEKVSFIEAVRTLAERAGIALPVGQHDQEQATEHEAMLHACRSAGVHFHENMTSTGEGKLAFEYFRHRGFTDETIRKFGLGYSMNSWDDLIRYAQKEGIAFDVLDRAGLVVKRDDGSGYYDRFRGRAMFPIFSATGRTIGFGARKLLEQDPIQGKYINSPETPIYSKSQVLYGLFQAREAIREKEVAILVEGYADLITAFQEGVENVVASSGTALTEGQIDLIGRYARSITLVYDADSAGSKATMRGVDLIIERNLEVRVAELPPGEDPDSFIRKRGAGEFLTLIGNAVSFLDFKASTFRERGMFSSPEGTVNAVRSLVETIARMKDELKRNLYIKSLAERFDIYEPVLFRELERQLSSKGHRQPAARTETSAAQSSQEQNPQGKVEAPEIPPVERHLLRLMLENGNEMIHHVFTYHPPDAFSTPHSQALAHVLAGREESGEEMDVSDLLGGVSDPAVKNLIVSLTIAKHEISKGWAEMDALPEVPDPWEDADRCLITLQRQEIDRRIAVNQKRLKEVSAAGGEVTEFLEQHQLLLAERKELGVARKGLDA